MDNNMILKIALRQSAYDCCCAPEDFVAAHIEGLYVVNGDVVSYGDGDLRCVLKAKK